MYIITPRMEILSSGTWYKATELLRIVIRIRTILYEHRLGPEGIIKLKAVFVDLGKARTGCPFSTNARFPASLCYVCEPNGDWATLLQQLRLGLCRLTIDQPSTMDLTFSFKDPELALWEATSNVMGSIGNMRSVIVRETIEAEMKWQR